MSIESTVIDELKITKNNLEAAESDIKKLKEFIEILQADNSALQSKIDEIDTLREENESLRALFEDKSKQNGWALNLLSRLVSAIENNTENEPSISCYYRALAEAKSFVGRIERKEV